MKGPNLLTRGFLILPVLFSFLVCGKEGEADRRVLRHKSFEIRENPASIPRELPRIFYYFGSKVKRTGVYKSRRYFASPEGVAVFTSKDAPERIEEFYIKAIRKYGWKIIQSHRKPGEILLMTESAGTMRYPRLITVIIRGKGPSTIKIYYRRTNG